MSFVVLLSLFCAMVLGFALFTLVWLRRQSERPQGLARERDGRGSSRLVHLPEYR